MKKTYMKPEMEAYDMNVESLICVSKLGEATQDGPVLIRELDDWDEEDNPDFND